MTQSAQTLSASAQGAARASFFAANTLAGGAYPHAAMAAHLAYPVLTGARHVEPTRQLLGYAPFLVLNVAAAGLPAVLRAGAQLAAGAAGGALVHATGRRASEDPSPSQTHRSPGAGLAAAGAGAAATYALRKMPLPSGVYSRSAAFTTGLIAVAAGATALERRLQAPLQERQEDDTPGRDDASRHPMNSFE